VSHPQVPLGSSPRRHPPPALALLDAALTWTHGTLQPARVSDTTLPTPCEAWDLRALLVHMEDSLQAFTEAAATGHVARARTEAVTRAEPAPAPELVDRICRCARTTRAAWRERITSAPVTVGDPVRGPDLGLALGLGRDTTALVGALEIVVHGWDVARATGSPTSIPPDLAARLLPVARTVVTSTERSRRFAAPRPLGPTASSAERLLAHLGRDPGWSSARRALAP
jgi:uncharacterized protein (TIGR03086 family)